MVGSTKVWRFRQRLLLLTATIGMVAAGLISAGHLAAQDKAASEATKQNASRGEGAAQGAMLGVSADSAQGQNGQQDGRGVLIHEVLPDGPADKAKVQPGDVILSIDEQSIESAEQLQKLMRQMKPKAEVKLVGVRDGRRYQTTATLGDPEELTDARDDEEIDDTPWLGVWLNEGEAPKDGSGATIGRVYPTSPAAVADLQDGDCVVAVDGKRVASAEEFVKLIEQHKAGDSLKLTVKCDDQEEPRAFQVTLARRGEFLGPEDAVDDQSPASHDPLYDVPEYLMRMEHERRMAEHQQRTEELMLQVLLELRQLKKDVTALQDAQQKTRSAKVPQK